MLKLSEIVTLHDENNAKADKLTEMLENLQNLTLTKPITEEYSSEIDKTGIRLERDVTTGLLETLDSINMTELNIIKQDLIQSLDSLHSNVTNEYYNGSIPIYDAMRGTKISKDLLEEVQKAQSKLPHGYPNVLSWFDEASYVQQTGTDLSLFTERAYRYCHFIKPSSPQYNQ